MLCVHARNDVAGSFTGEHWLDQVMQLPNCNSTLLIFTQAGMVHAVAVHQLPTDQGSSFGDLAISKVRNYVFLLSLLLRSDDHRHWCWCTEVYYYVCARQWSLFWSCIIGLHLDMVLARYLLSLYRAVYTRQSIQGSN